MVVLSCSWLAAVSAEGKGAPPGSLPALAQMISSSVRAFYGPGALAADTLSGATCLGNLVRTGHPGSVPGTSVLGKSVLLVRIVP